MVTVYVWSSKKTPDGKNVGHAAMSVNGSTYISWWPDTAAGITGNFHPIRNKTFQSDVRDEGGHPDHTINISFLDEKAILDWWRGFGLVGSNGQEIAGPMLPYNLLKQNCSTVVSMALKQGGADKYSSFFRAHNVIWTPNSVLQYAKSILSNGR